MAPIILIAGGLAGLAWWGSRKVKDEGVSPLPVNAPTLGGPAVSAKTPLAVPQATWGAEAPDVDPLTDLPQPIAYTGTAYAVAPSQNANANPYTAPPEYLVTERDYFGLATAEKSEADRETEKEARKAQNLKGGWEP